MRTVLCFAAVAALCAAQESNAPAARTEWDVTDVAALRLGGLKSRMLAVSSIAELARVTCRYDRLRATSMLFRAFEILKKADYGASGSGPAALLRSSEQCAPEVAALIVREPQRFHHSFSDQVRNARSAIGSEEEGDESRAADLLESAAPELPYASVKEMLAFVDALFELRAASRAEGDRAFSATLEALVEDRVSSLQAIFAIGNYVFGPPPRSETEIESRDAGSGVAFRLEADRPSVSDAAAVAYIEAAATVLDASKASGDEAELDRDLVTQLLRHASRLAPDIAEDLVPIARRLGLEVEALNGDSGEETRLAEKALLSAFRLHWVAGHAQAARQTAGGLFRQPVRQQMDVLAHFAEAREALRTKQPEAAFAISSAMPGGTHRTLVHLGVGAYEAALKGKERARDMAFLGLREALTAPPEHRPGLQIIAVRILAEADTETAFSTLSHAVDSLNAMDAARPRENSAVRLSRWGFSESVSLGHEARRFALVLPGLPAPDLGAAAADLANIDAARTEDILVRLRSERRLAEALVTLASRTVERAHRP
ncbi:MAG TPA: hypothetical protein VN428_20035 [Bryobacteraceae bacterium]|nr:hypothetical protein [Bryobacteraceae bacterium]